MNGVRNEYRQSRFGYLKVICNGPVRALEEGAYLYW